MFLRRPKSAPPPPSPASEPGISQAWPPGHFYSPIPNPQDVATAFDAPQRELLGIDLNLDAQRTFLDDLARVFPSLRFPETAQPGRRYFYDNGSFGALDAICLAAMAQRFRCRQIVEVGSGHSSAAMLDLRDDGVLAGAEFTFIDPDFSRLRPLLLPGDEAHLTLREQRVQDVDPEFFEALGPGDLLFIDSSHVCKIGSDVNQLLFAVLPRLKSGVLIHFHDVFDGFEYPKAWLAEGRYWNEQYALRAFLMFNHAFKILLHTASVFHRFNDFFRERLPVTLRHGGGQLWLQRL